MSALACQLELGDFVAQLMSRMPHWCCDVQAAFLAGGADRPQTLGKNHRDRAARSVLQTSFLGVVDQFEQSLLAGEFFLRPVFPGLRCSAWMVNATQGLDGTLEERKRYMRDACGDRLYSELVSRNELDLGLVSFARTEVERRFRLASERRFDPLVRGVGRTS